MLLPILTLLSELLLSHAIDERNEGVAFGHNEDYARYTDHSPGECLEDSYGGFHYSRNPSMDYGSYYNRNRPYNVRHRNYHQGNNGHRYGHRNPHLKPRKSKSTVKPHTTSTSSPPQCGRNYQAKIIGGKPTDARNWRWMASIMKRPNEHMCGGSLISRHYVLTAAHCIDRVNIQVIHVRLGEHDFDRADDGTPEDYLIAKLVKHPQYDRVGYKNDIGLIKLAKEVSLSPSINTICLPDRPQDYSGKDAVVVGWGLQSYGGKNSNALRRVTVIIWNNTQCGNAYSFTIPIQPYYMCAGSKDGQDSCSGDSGGPLMIQTNDRWIAIGVVSWGFRCGEPAFPGVYARIDYFIEWIKRNTVQ